MLFYERSNFGTEFATWLPIEGPMRVWCSHPNQSLSLQVDVSKVPDLLAADEVEELIQRYLDTTRDNMTEWMKNSLTSDKVKWQSSGKVCCFLMRPELPLKRCLL